MKLHARKRPPLAIIGGATSDRAVRLASALAALHPAPADPAPVFLITTATAEKTAENALLSAVALPSGAESDALSTALLTAPELFVPFIERRPAIRCLVVRGTENAPIISAHGVTVRESF